MPLKYLVPSAYSFAIEAQTFEKVNRCCEAPGGSVSGFLFGWCLYITLCRFGAYRKNEYLFGFENSEFGGKYRLFGAKKFMQIFMQVFTFDT